MSTTTDRNSVSPTSSKTSGLPPSESKAVLAAVLCAVSDSVVVFDAAGAIQVVNPAAESMLERSATELIGSHVDEVMPGLRGYDVPDVIDLTDRREEQRERYREVTVERSLGRATIEVSISAVDLDDRCLFACVGRDVSERKQSEDMLRRRADTDSLTRLVNRESLHRALVGAAGRAEKGAPFALLFGDLDGFKAVNDQFGHDIGDQVLTAAARRLENAVRRDDLVARYGGDEFVIVVESGEDILGDLRSIRRRIEASFRQPFAAGEQLLPLGISIGQAIYGHDAHTISQLIQHADADMYAQKAAARAAPGVPIPKRQELSR